MYGLDEHWRKHPPTHLLVAAYLGHKAGERDDDNRGDDIGDLMSLIGGE